MKLAARLLVILVFVAQTAGTAERWDVPTGIALLMMLAGAIAALACIMVLEEK